MNSARLTYTLASWSPPLLWGLAILLFSGDWGSSHNTLGIIQWFLSRIPHMSPGQIAAIHGILRKLGHMVAYGVLCFLWFRSFQVHWPEGRRLCLFLAVLCSLLVALLDEGHQAMVGTRRGSLIDVGWDLAGVSLSGLFILAFYRPKASAMQA
jgi:VanZ family protein